MPTGVEHGISSQPWDSDHLLHTVRWDSESFNVQGDLFHIYLKVHFLLRQQA